MAGALKHGAAGGVQPERSVDSRTLGEWLDERLRQAAPVRPPEPFSPASEHRRIAEALERLARRLESQERRSAVSAESVDHALSDLRDRVGAAESLQTDTADRLLRTFLSLERAQTSLTERISAIETEAAPHQSLARLEAKTQALASAVEDSRGEVERDLAELREGIATLARAARESLDEIEGKLAEAPFASREALGILEREIRGLRGTMERTQRELQTRMEMLSDHQAKSAQHSDLTALSKQAAALADRQEAALAHLAARLEALADGAVSRADLEERTRTAAQILAERQEDMGRRQEAALAALADRQDETAQALRGRIENLRDQIVHKDELESRLRAVREERHGSMTAVEARLDDLSARMPSAESLAESARHVSANLAALNERLSGAEAERQLAQSAQDRRISELRAWVEAAEGRAEAAAEAARSTAMQRYEELARLGQERIEAAERRSAEALLAFATEQRALHDRLSQVTQATIAGEITGLRDDLERSAATLAERADAAIESAKRELDARVASAIAGLEAGAIASGLSTAMERIHAVETSQKDLAQDVSVELRRWSEAIDKRLRGVDGRLTVEGQALQRLSERFERLETHAVEAAGDTRDALAQLGSQIEERASVAERRAAQALEQVGAQIVELADRLEQRQRAMLRDANERLEAAERHAEESAAAFARDITERLLALESRVAQEQPLAAPTAEAMAAEPEPEAPQASASASTMHMAVNFSFRPEDVSGSYEDSAEPDEDELPLPAHLAEEASESLGAFETAVTSEDDQELPAPAPTERSKLRRKSVADALDAVEAGGLEPIGGDSPLYVEDFEQQSDEGPRYDFVDALDAILNQAPSVGGQGGLGQRPAGAPVSLLGDPPIELQTAAAQAPRAADTLAAPMPNAREPLDPAGLAADLFDGPEDAPKAAAPPRPASQQPSREPAYLAAARRAAQERVEAAAKPARAPGKSNPLMRALLWGAAAVAVGSSIYALSRNDHTALDGEPSPTPPGPVKPTAENLAPASIAAKLVTQAAADRIALDQGFAPTAVELPQEGEEPPAVPPPSGATPLESADASATLTHASPRG